MLAIALPVPVIVSNFAYYYSKENGRQSNVDEDEEEDETEQENEPVNNEAKKKISLNCTGKKYRKNKGSDTKPTMRKRKFGTVKFPDTIYNAIDSNVNMDHQNGLANANSVRDKNDQQNQEKKISLSQVETVV